MLLSFKVRNYKSFLADATFSMIAAPKQKGLDYSLMKEKIRGKVVNGLSTAVIYGPNAAGKTNIIGAMDVLRAIVLRGNIRNSEDRSSPNPAASSLELIPNSKLESAQPVCFSIEFTVEDPDRQGTWVKVHFELSIDLGLFMDENYHRRILSETLWINEKQVYQRSDCLRISDMNVIKRFFSEKARKNFADMFEIAENSLANDELFLTNGFKLIYSQKLARLITEWFAGEFMIICRADSMRLIGRFADPAKNTVYVEKTINQAARFFGINSNAVGYAISEDETEAKLVSIIKNVNQGNGNVIPADIFESYGTLRFINMFPLVIRAMQTGGTLVVDEFDASIHPMALMSIINIFHNDDLNIHHAQLIFNTHNPVFLNSNLFRRDEIKFVERDDDTHESMLYALSDFGTSGSKGVRKHEDYMKNYFVSRYGAIKSIDFTPIFEDILGVDGKD